MDGTLRNGNSLDILTVLKRTYLANGDLHQAREYTNLPGFDPTEHSLFRIHTHVTPQGFIFVNFDASETPQISFADQFGDDFDPTPTSETGKAIGDEYHLFHREGWEYDHTWKSSTAGTKFNWKTFADGFQECYHCQTGHPTTLPKDFCLKDYYLRQGIGASRHFLPPADKSIGESYITWLYPIGAIIFSDNLLFIARYNATGALETSYQSETYRRADMQKPSADYDHWMQHDIAYWRFVEIEDVELAVQAQKGFSGGILGKGRLHPVQGTRLIISDLRRLKLMRLQNTPLNGIKIKFVERCWNTLTWKANWGRI